MKLVLLFISVCALTYGNPVGDLDLTTEPPNTTTNSSDTTNSTESPSTVGPVSTDGGHSSSMPVSIETASTENPITVEPISGETAMPGTTETSSPATTTQSQPSSTGTRTSTNPTPTPKPKKGGFDGGSFAGGIALGAGVAIILYIAYRIYAAKKTSGYSTM